MINIKEFVLLIDSAQDEDTNIIINVEGEEMASGTLEEALMNVINSNPDSNFMVKSFAFCNMNLVIECQVI